MQQDETENHACKMDSESKIKTVIYLCCNAQTLDNTDKQLQQVMEGIFTQEVATAACDKK